MRTSKTTARIWLVGLAIAIGVASCRTSVPGYRHEGQGPDERLLDLMDRHELEKDAWREDRHGSDHLLVDGGRMKNELRRLHLDFPGHVPTLFALATLTYERGSKERAGGYLDQLFALQPVHAEAGVLRSRIAIGEGNLGAAGRVLEQQVRYTPDHAGLREALSCVAFLDHDFETARAELEIAARLGAPEWRIAFNLGLIEEGVGNGDLAIEQYEIALEGRPGWDLAVSRLAGLRALRGEVVR